MERKVLLVLIPLFTTAFVVTDFGAGLIESSVAMAEKKKKKKRQGVFERLFQPRDPPPEIGTPARGIPPRALSPRGTSPNKRRVPQASGIRTLCVRTCDGYYFPISYSASRKRFKIDEAVCKAMYGGANATLYIHDNGSPADTAVSLKGKPLAREPNAFAFRQTFSETCQAELKNGLSRLTMAFVEKAAEFTAERREPAERLPPIPASRLVAGLDPETVANRAGSFLAEPVLSPKDDAVAFLVRKLGADYYYADPIVIETLRDPPRSGPEFTLIGSANANQRKE